MVLPRRHRGRPGKGTGHLARTRGRRGLRRTPVGPAISFSEDFRLIGQESGRIVHAVPFQGTRHGRIRRCIKNMSIGIASGEGKMWIHTAGVTRNLDDFALCFKTEQDLFLESMAEAAGSVIDKLGADRIVYVNLMNNLSIDCDCDSNPAPPELADIGILASMDPVALDRACVDLIYAADEEKSASLRRRMEEKHATHTLDRAEALGIGRQQYTLIGIDA
ncbi:DUF362 domain-containing protein [Pseudodesulfovibrio thermohalotolerans]|uniref:DUF362 domain-containing protein n=1 Tax=Pseudodesulfovibrio thermohalotolerans TaxID=2880651 RepID=UPI0024431798|nr:DUF362 domain-containing protein [Pseudodesulfovibrio thermohalotolerans]WFS64364.1 DUF362 domain-containing protein [Pseudodesulfovibrio thermohalotolerans]